VTRRDALRGGILAGVGLAVGCRRGSGVDKKTETETAAQPPPADPPRAADPTGLIMKPIPSSGQRVPVVGIGTNTYDLSDELRARLRDVMRRFVALGGSVYDTATGYTDGQSEQVLGLLSEELGLRDRLFFVTKVVAPDDDLDRGRALFETSLERLRTDRIDGLLVHNLNGTDVLLPAMQEWKQAGRIKYFGISTSRAPQYADLIGYMRRFPLDIIQVDYSLGNRGATRVLDVAQERGIAVMINVPFGGRRGASTNFARLASTPIPEWAREYGIATWPQFLLKYLVSHPAVTVVIPGTRRVEHLEDNLGAARGRLPDAATRTRMEQFYDQIPA
jgi:aryl-alcohol dehydrogenase-like predicted oxidoreductase